MSQRTKIKLLENETIIPLELKVGHRSASWFTEGIAARKIAEYAKIELSQEYETVYDSTSFLFTKLYDECLDPRDYCDILKELSTRLNNETACLCHRNIIQNFVNKKLVSYNDLKPLMYSLLNLEDYEISELTHNQTTNF